MTAQTIQARELKVGMETEFGKIVKVEDEWRYGNVWVEVVHTGGNGMEFNLRSSQEVRIYA